MIVCGLKLTHDGAVAVLDGDRLVAGVEMEKVDNRPRYQPVDDLRMVRDVLAGLGYTLDDVDRWVIDGWDGDRGGHVTTADGGIPCELAVGPYRESEHHPDPTAVAAHGTVTVDGRAFPYVSFSHVAGHLASTYCSSPFAGDGEPTAVLVWDGGLFPRLYRVEADGRVHCDGALFGLIGHVYATAGHHFGPFRRDRQSGNVDDLSVAGKLMAYIALGKSRESVISILYEALDAHIEGGTPEAEDHRRLVGGFGSLVEPSMPGLHAFFASVRRRVDEAGVSDEDVLASVHTFLERLLTERLAARLLAWDPARRWNLCVAGGCALNIKWNSALRAMPETAEVWVPPFPNDSGSAIGAALLGRGDGTLPALRWHARLGPALVEGRPVPAGWTGRPCSVAELAAVLHTTGEPVVLLDGRAELGPRALGARSIVAPATDPAMKPRLNDIKRREHYRPVAPICLVDRAPDIFDPGTPDPYMLFDHDVRPAWLDRIPAVVHLDGTARLQTVAARDAPVLAELLTEYQARSGVPVLCNTSANHHGRGFFPDVASALHWGGVGRVWSAGTLWERDAEQPRRDPADPTSR